MFFRPNRIAKYGKDHTYGLFVETVRTPDGPRQRTVYYWGELNYSTQSRWLKAIKVFNEKGERRQLKLFPSDVEPPANDPYGVRTWVKTIRLECARRFGDCFLGLERWKGSRETCPPALLAINRLCALQVVNPRRQIRYDVISRSIGRCRENLPRPNIGDGNLDARNHRARLVRNNPVDRRRN